MQQQPKCSAVSGLKCICPKHPGGLLRHKKEPIIETSLLSAAGCVHFYHESTHMGQNVIRKIQKSPSTNIIGIIENTLLQLSCKLIQQKIFTINTTQGNEKLNTVKV